MKHEEHVQSVGCFRSDLIIPVWHGEHHVKEVLRIWQVIARIRYGLPDMAFIGSSRDGTGLCQQQRCGPTKSRFLGDVDFR